MLRIALVTRRYPPLIGGAEKVLSYLAEAFARLGCQVTVLTSHIDPSLPATETPTPNLTIERLATSPLRFVGTWLYMRNLRRWFAKNRVDVAYVSMLKHDAYVVVKEGRARGFPVVLRPEGAGQTGDIAWQNWGRFGSKIAECCKRADAFVAISATVRSELIEAGYDPERIVDLPNGVPVAAEPWDPSQAASHRAVFVGRLAEEKNLTTLIDAWPLVLREHPDARLTLVGEGPMRSALESRAEERNVRHAVVFAGSSTDPQAHLRAADLFVLPSKEEGMSIALLEAMSLGMPLVASDIPGNRKLVEDGTHGRLFPPLEPETLAATIVSAWSEPERSLEMGRKARGRVESTYSIEAVAREHLRLFDRLRG